MEFYKISLLALKRLFEAVELTEQAQKTENAIHDYETGGNPKNFIEMINGKNSIKNTSVFAEESSCVTVESQQWVNGLIDALIAMCCGLATAIITGNEKRFTIEFIRKHFGHEIMTINGTECNSCKHRQISLLDIDEFIIPPVISVGIADGLEKGSLNTFVDDVLAMRAEGIEECREITKQMIIASGIPISHSHSHRTYCLLCGSDDIKKCRFLKTANRKGFIPLG